MSWPAVVGTRNACQGSRLGQSPTPLHVHRQATETHGSAQAWNAGAVDSAVRAGWWRPARASSALARLDRHGVPGHPGEVGEADNVNVDIVWAVVEASVDQRRRGNRDAAQIGTLDVARYPGGADVAAEVGDEAREGGG